MISWVQANAFTASVGSEAHACAISSAEVEPGQRADGGTVGAAVGTTGLGVRVGVSVIVAVGSKVLVAVKVGASVLVEVAAGGGVLVGADVGTGVSVGPGIGVLVGEAAGVGVVP